MNTDPRYQRLSSREFRDKVDKAQSLLAECTVCPRECRVDRTVGEQGQCNAGEQIELHSKDPHFGEERPLVGQNGSRTLFLANCNLNCAYCQNYRISRMGEELLTTPPRLPST